MNNKAFSLIELIIAIAIISIVATFAFVAVSPVKRTNEAKDGRRLVEARSILKAIEKYAIDNNSLPPSIAGLDNDVAYVITATSTAGLLSCDVSGDDNSAEEVYIGTELAAYLSSIPIDPDINYPDVNGTGYFVIKRSNYALEVKPCNLSSDLYASGAGSIPSSPTWDESLDPDGIVNFTEDSVEIQWNIPDDGGSIITDYVIQYRFANNGAWITFDDGVDTNNSVTITLLSDNTNYGFWVAAINDVGQGAFSTELTQYTAQDHMDDNEAP